MDNPLCLKGGGGLTVCPVGEGAPLLAVGRGMLFASQFVWM